MLVESGDLRALNGTSVSGRLMCVVSVPADEGFWTANTDDDRVWGQIRTHDQESRKRIEVGDAVTFTGRVATHDDDFAKDVGVARDEGAGPLTREGAHVTVAARYLQVDRS